MARDAGKAKFWQEKMEAYEGSGLRVREFCAREQLREVQFYYWRRALKAGEERGAVGFMELVGPGLSVASAGVSVRIDDRLSIVLDRGFDGEALRAALAIAREVCGL
jgi:hypothetical protein